MAEYLAFDLGASSGRAILGKLTGKTLILEEIHRFPNGPVESSGSLYWDFDRLADEIQIGLAKAVKHTPNLAGIAIDTWGVDYVLFSPENGKKIRNPYNYRDTRGGNAREMVRKILPDVELYTATGLQNMPFNTIYQLAAHQMQHPEDFHNAKFLMMPDALSYTLGGDFTSEYTDCSTTALLDPKTGNWHWEIIDKIKLPRQIFPPVVLPFTRGGELSEQLRQKLNVGAIPIWKIGSHDTASAVCAVPAPENSSWAYVSCGTWALLGAEIPHELMSREAMQKSFTNEGGVDHTIRFLTNIMGSWLFQEMRRVRSGTGCNYSFAQMEDLARHSTPNLAFINPNDASLAAPCNMPEQIRELCKKSGQYVPRSDGEIIRVIYDSLARSFAEKIHELEELLNTRYSALNMVGGGTRDTLLMQLSADALQKLVIAGPVEATAIGNLLGQAIANGEVANLAAAREIVRNSFPVKTFLPQTINGIFA